MAEYWLIREQKSWGVSTWTNGFKETRPPERPLSALSEDIVLNRALCLEERGRSDKAEALLEDWVAAVMARFGR